MLNERFDEKTSKIDLPVLKVKMKNESTYTVQFPFSEVPVEMSQSYFNKNIDVDNYVIDFEDDSKPE